MSVDQQTTARDLNVGMFSSKDGIYSLETKQSHPDGKRWFYGKDYTNLTTLILKAENKD